MTTPLQRWLPAGTAFDPQQHVFWAGKAQGRSLAEALPGVQVLLLGAHASAAIPEELREFIAPQLTARQQFDFSDVSTAALARAWCARDEAVLYIENPMSRLVLDPNRAAPADIEPGLREAFARIAATPAGSLPKLGGVDAVRPVSFAGAPVLRAPDDDSGWARLLAALNACALCGPRSYAAQVDQLLDEILAQRPAGDAAPLHVISLHDTMNTTCRADGAIVQARAPADCLPALANIGNRGNPDGEAEGDTPVTLPAVALRRVAAALREAFGVQAEAVTLNRPYKGAEETRRLGRRLQGHARRNWGVWQLELLREALLGPAATAHLQAPGTDWPPTDTAHVEQFAVAMERARQQWSAW
jgi:hypothetical protein